MAIEKAKIAAINCQNMVTRSLKMWNNAIWMGPICFVVSITWPNALRVRNMVLRPYKYPATTRDRLLVTDSDTANVTILRTKVAKKMMSVMRSKMFHRSLQTIRKIRDRYKLTNQQTIGKKHFLLKDCRRASMFWAEHFWIRIIWTRSRSVIRHSWTRTEKTPFTFNAQFQYWTSNRVMWLVA